MVNLKELFLGLQKQMEMYLVNDRQFIGHSASKGDASENRNKRQNRPFNQYG